MYTNQMVQKVQEKFSSVFSYLQQVKFAPKDEIVYKLLQLDAQIRDLIEEEENELTKLNMVYPLIYVDSGLDNLNYMDPEKDEFAIDQAREGVRIAFQIFSRLYRDQLQ